MNYNDFKEWAWNTWSDFHAGEKPAWGDPEFRSLHTAYKRCPGDVQRAWTAYLRSSDTFYAGKSPKLFVANLDRWRSAGFRLADDGAPSPGPPPAAMLEVRDGKKLAREKARQAARRARGDGTAPKLRLAGPSALDRKG